MNLPEFMMCNMRNRGVSGSNLQLCSSPQPIKTKYFMRLALAAFSLLCLSVNAAPLSLRTLDEATLTARQSADLRAVDTYRAGLARAIEFARVQTAIFPAKRGDKRLLADDEKKQARSVWKAVLDYQLALEAIERAHRDFLLLKNRSLREGSLLTHHAAHAARYRFALDFIERVENDSELAKILNEPVAELGLTSGAYDQFKFHFLNVAEGSQFAALAALYKASGKRATGNTAAALSADSERLWEMGRGKGVAMTFANAGNIVRNAGQRAVFPIQAGVSEWMGDTKVRRQHDALISEAQIKTLPARMQPGDVMLQRREWYVSNVGLPGFWSHAALYIGTAEERRAFFNDAEVIAWVKSQGIADGNFETLLRTRYASAYQSALAPQEHGHVPRVLEAISEGVSFTTIEHSAAADSLVTLRPKLSKRDKAFAILRAFGYAGRPYDFDFDFQTDTSLVCTELIYKAYEPGASFKGITMKSQEILGRLAIPANDIAVAFDREFGNANEQWEMVFFLDGSERQKRAAEADVSAFRASWQRPKWHIMLPESAAANTGKKP
jgi:Permuted papain-like amidase enzyme, YaeF/YiiX, C92 family